jgi:hypothetical protein
MRQAARVRRAALAGLALALLAAGTGCTKTHVYYMAEKADSYVLTRKFDTKVPWDSLILVQNADGVDLVVNPYEPAEGEGQVYLAVDNRSKGVKFYPEEIVLVDPYGVEHSPAAEHVSPLQAFTIAIPESETELRKKAGPVFRCMVRLGFRGIELEECKELLFRFAYRREGEKEMLHHEIRLRRLLAEY